MSRLFIVALLALLAGGSAGNDLPSASDWWRTDAAELDSSAASSDGQREMKALALAYSDRITQLGRRDGEWAVRIENLWYSWAKGRIMPEALKGEWNRFAPVRFYNYPLDLPPIPRLDREAKERLQEMVDRAETDPPERHEAFLGHLHRAATRSQTEERIVTVYFHGLRVNVHERLVEPLKEVEARLQHLVRTNARVRKFFAGIEGLAGYNWRPIAGTRSRSYHSYGLALDLVPESFGARQAYWRWAMAEKLEWFSVPYSRRWLVPMPVVRAFEEQGFIWGGKWFFFDTMHFEYRPEILILARRS